MNLRIYRRVEERANLLEYVGRGDLQAVKAELTRKHSSIHDVWDIGGRSALYLAVAAVEYGPGSSHYQNQVIDLLQILLAEGADLFQENDFGATPCEGLVLSFYANPTLPWSFRNRLENSLPMNRIIEHCDFTNLHKAVLGLTSSKISNEYLRSEMETVGVDSVDELGQTALVYACARGDEGVIEALLGAGAAPGTISASKSLRTLGWACHYIYPRIVRMLLKAGPNVNAKGHQSRTPLHHACSARKDTATADIQNAKNRLQVVSELIAHGADPYALCYYDCSVLHKAVYSNAVSVVALLVHLWLTADHQDKDGKLPLSTVR